jgi:hypothetical protein
VRHSAAGPVPFGQSGCRSLVSSVSGSASARQALVDSAIRFLFRRSRSLGSPTLSKLSGGRRRLATSVSGKSRTTPSGLLHVARESRRVIHSLRLISLSASRAKLALPSGSSTLRGVATRPRSLTSKAARLRRTWTSRSCLRRKGVPTSRAGQTPLRLPHIMRLACKDTLKPELAPSPIVA